MNRRSLVHALIFIIIYVALANARSVEPHPIIPEARIAIHIIVPAIAGILFGWKAGVLVGIGGTLLNSWTPAGGAFEMASLIPNALLGGVVGFYHKRLPLPILGAFVLPIHVLRVILFYVFNLIERSTLSSSVLWSGLLIENLIGVISIIVISTLYRLISQEAGHPM